MQITSAMKMVSAAKLKKAQDAITAMRPYSNKLSELMQSFSGSGGSGNKSFNEKRKLNNVLIVSNSSNRGLCGAFNSNIVKESLKNEKIDDKITENSLSVPLKEAREKFEKEYLTIQLKKFNGNISKTANFVGMERSALHRKLKGLGIKEFN